MTGVRSFDVKAYDDLFGGFVDLGWGDDVRLTGVAPQYLLGTPATTTWGGKTVNTASSFAHEGRMPPLRADQRFDAQYGQVGVDQPCYAGYTYDGNVGDDRPGVVRMRRVWDSWSTAYMTGLGSAQDPSPAGTIYGPPLSPPVYPAYPPPYPAPLKGVQIQIRVVDPTNQRIKQVTIRQDFTDKL
jgi:hypothetical protein